MATAVRVRVRGSVQGVSFRATMARKAAEFRVRGWVRNLPDGSVEALLEGEESGVRSLLEWARAGPPGARVDRVDVLAESPRNRRGFLVY